MHLIFQEQIFAFSEPIPNFTPSTNFSERYRTYVALSEEQEAYYAEHPLATVEEVWNMGSTSAATLTNDEIRLLRQAAYEQRSDSLYMAYQKYLALGDTNKAEEAWQAWMTEVTAIDAEYPYNY